MASLRHRWLAVFLLALLASACGCAGAGTGSSGFTGTRKVVFGVADKEHEFEDHPIKAVVGDFDGDSVMDVIVLSSRSISDQWQDLSLLLGLGDGWFDPERRLDIDTRGHVVAADLNEDGATDLIVARRTSMSYPLDVLLSNGDGTFALPQEVGEADGPIAAADFDSDGIIDLAAVKRSPGDHLVRFVFIFRGNGDGSFDPLATGRAVAGRPKEIVIADLNADGHADVVTNNLINPPSVLFGDGNGSLSPERPIGGIGGISGLAVVDLNRDGHVDLVGGTRESRIGDAVSLIVWLGQEDGTFELQRRVISSIRPRRLAVADVDLDGSPDLVTDDGILFGVGDGSFLPGARLGTNVSDVATADLDGDGNADVLTTDYASNALLVALVGETDFAATSALPVSHSAEALAAGDIDGDGRVDLIMANKSTSTVFMLRGTGDGTFGSEELLFSGASGVVRDEYLEDSTPDVHVTDLDGDGATDIVFSVADCGVGVLRGPVEALRYPWSSAGECYPGAVGPLAVGDVDGDGNLDVVTSSIEVLRGRGDGTFGFHSAADPPDLSSVGDSVLLDLDGDGNLDLVVGGDGPLQVYAGFGDGSFGLRATVQTQGRAVRSIAAGDVDGTGTADLVLGLNPAAWAFVPVHEDGSLERATVEVPPGFRGHVEGDSLVKLADLGGGEALDLVLVNIARNEVQTYRGVGDGTFELEESVAVGVAPVAVLVADLNEDGIADVATGNDDPWAYMSPHVSLLFGRLMAGSYPARDQRRPPDFMRTKSQPSDVRTISNGSGDTPERREL